jgi:hypothetical protein
VSNEHDAKDVVAQAFEDVEAGIEDAGFSQAVASRLTFKIRARRIILAAVAFLGLLPFLLQLETGRRLLTDLPAQLVDFGAPLQSAAGVDWLAALVLFLAIPAVLFKTLFAVLFAMRVRST